MGGPGTFFGDASGNGTEETGATSPGSEAPAGKTFHRFHGTVVLGPSRVGSSAGRIAEEVLSHLSGLVGAKVTVTLEIDVEVPNGIPEDKIRIVNENSNTLKFRTHEFEEQ